MITNKLYDAADYIVGKDGQPIALNEAGQAVLEQFHEAERARETLQAAWAGAMIATVFIELTWLQAMTFELTASAEYDDDGGSYRSITVEVRDALPVNGADIPEDFGGSFDDFDAERAADEIKERLSGDSPLLYEAFENRSNDFSDFTLRVDRDAIAEILATGNVKGKQAFVALFPSYAHHVTH